METLSALAGAERRTAARLPAAAFRPRRARQLNPGLAINPRVATFGSCNAILTGTARQYFVPDFKGPLSLKATLQGTSTWKVDGRNFRVSESTYLLVNEGQPYTITYDEPDEVTTFCLLFKDRYLQGIAAAMRLGPTAMLNDSFRADSLEFPNRLHAGPSTTLTKLRAFADELQNELIDAEIWELRFHSLAVTLLREWNSCAPRPMNINGIKHSTRQELLKRVALGRDFLISMSDRPIMVEDAARAACMSTFHFHRVFLEAFGVSPHVFLRNFRIHRAAHLLRYSDLPVSEVARRVGFASVGSFGNAFHKILGAAPGNLRRRFNLATS